MYGFERLAFDSTAVAKSRLSMAVKLNKECKLCDLLE